MSFKTSYEGLYGKGDRLSVIKVTNKNWEFRGGESPSSLIDGKHGNNFWFSPQVANGGWIEFEFNDEIWIDEFKWYQSGGNPAHPDLQLAFEQYVDNQWRELTIFSLQELTQTIQVKSDVTPMLSQRYRVYGRSGSLSNNCYQNEIEFKYTDKLTEILIKTGDQYLGIQDNIPYLTEEVIFLSLPVELTSEIKVLLQQNSQGVFHVLLNTDSLSHDTYIQTTHELNLLQDDLLQADKIQLLNWFESEEEVELGVTGDLRGQFSAINEVKSTSEISKMVANDNNLGTKYLVSPNKSEWFRIDGTEWEKVEWEDKREINNLGMSKNTLKDITDKLWDKLGNQVYLGVYLHDYESSIIDIDFQSLSHDKTPTVKDAKLYILNTQATIDMTIHGSTLVGKIKDEDEGKVQYRIILNGEPIFPADGTYTPLSPEPNHINFKIPSKLINMGEPNSVRIDFQDAWGSEDSWQSLFLGELNGLLFMDEGGELYSDDTGEVFKNLDFGLVIAGQLTSTHKVIFKNTMGTPVKDITFTSNWGDDEPVPGVGFYFSETETPFESNTTLTLEKPMKHEEEIALYIKMGTTLGTTPETAGKVRFCVQATEITNEEYEEIMKDFQEPEEPEVEEEQKETEE